MKKVILTKKRLKALDLAITLDDILYAKFDQMYKRFQEYTRQWDRKRQVLKVIQKKENVNYILQIVKEIKTDEGIILEVT